jgi:hypothetical protein
MTEMTKSYLSDNVQNHAGTRTLELPKQPWSKVLPALLERGELIVLALPGVPALIAYLLFGNSLLFQILFGVTALFLLSRIGHHRKAVRVELRRYHKARKTQLLDETELQALNLCARFIYRDQGWYHTYETYPFWDRKAGYDDPAFSKSDPYFQMRFDYSEQLAQGLKRDWGISSKQGTMAMVHGLRDGQHHRCAIIGLIEREGFSTVYDILSDLTGLPQEQFHPVFFPDHEDADLPDDLDGALAIFELETGPFLEAIQQKCDELDDPQSLSVHGDARDQIFQIVRHIGRLALRNDLRNIFLFSTEAIDKVLYPQGKDDLLALGWGFDLSRGMFLLRRAYAAGFITQEELRAELPGYRQIASAVFSDWESYFCSEVIGFLSWKMRDAELADAYDAAARAARECKGALAQGFPIGKQISWPEADETARRALRDLFKHGEVNPIFLPDTLGARANEDGFQQVGRPEDVVLH